MPSEATTEASFSLLPCAMAMGMAGCVRGREQPQAKWWQSSSSDRNQDSSTLGLEGTITSICFHPLRR